MWIEKWTDLFFNIFFDTYCYILNTWGFLLFLSLIYKIIILILKNLNSFSDKCKKKKIIYNISVILFFYKNINDTPNIIILRGGWYITLI